jgi:hypothetical protein
MPSYPEPDDRGTRMAYRPAVAFLALCTIAIWSGCGGTGNDSAFLTPAQTGAQIDLTAALAVPLATNPALGSSANVARLNGLQDPAIVPSTVAELRAELRFWVRAALRNGNDSAAQLGLALAIATCASQNASHAVGESLFGTTSVQQIAELGMSRELRPQELMSDAMAAMTSARVPPARATEAGEAASQTASQLRQYRRAVNLYLLPPLVNVQDRLIRVADRAPRARRLLRLTVDGRPIILFSADFRALGATFGLARCALMMATAVNPDYGTFDWGLDLRQRDADRDGKLTVAEYAPAPPFGDIRTAKWTSAGAVLREAVGDMLRALQEMTVNENELLQIALSEAYDPTQVEVNLTDAAAMLNGRVQVTVFYESYRSSAREARMADEAEVVTGVPFDLRELWDTPPASLLDLLPPLYLSLEYGTYQTGGTDLFDIWRGRPGAQNAPYHMYQLPYGGYAEGAIATGPAPHRLRIAAVDSFPGIDGRFNWNWTQFRGTWGASSVTATCADPYIGGVFRWSELPDPTISGALPNATKTKMLLYGDFHRVVFRYRSLVVRGG